MIPTFFGPFSFAVAQCDQLPCWVGKGGAAGLRTGSGVARGPDLSGLTGRYTSHGLLAIVFGHSYW